MSLKLHDLVLLKKCVPIIYILQILYFTFHIYSEKSSTLSSERQHDPLAVIMLHNIRNIYTQLVSK